MMGRMKFEKSLPYNVFKMADINMHMLRNMNNECEDSVNSLLSVSNRPFQGAKEENKISCAECYKDNGEIKFFSEGLGLSHHFKIKHRSVAFSENIVLQSKKLFQDLHGQETKRILFQISEERIKTVRTF